MKVPESLANNDRNKCLFLSWCRILRKNYINIKSFPEWLWVDTFFPSYSYKRQCQGKAISMCSYFSLSTSVIWVLIAAQLPSFVSCFYKAFERCCYSMVMGCKFFKGSYSDAIVTGYRLLQGLFGCICLYWVNVTISSECIFKCLLVLCSGYYRFLLLSSFGQFYFNVLFVFSLPDLYRSFCLNFPSKWIPVVLLGEVQSGFPSLQTVLYLLNEVRISVSGDETCLI